MDSHQIKDWRISKKLTQSQMGEVTKTSQETARRWGEGLSRPPIKLSPKILDYLLDNQGNPPLEKGCLAQWMEMKECESQKLADLLGVDRRTITNWKGGHVAHPRLLTIGLLDFIWDNSPG